MYKLYKKIKKIMVNFCPSQLELLSGSQSFGGSPFFKLCYDSIFIHVGVQGRGIRNYSNIIIIIKSTTKTFYYSYVISRFKASDFFFILSFSIQIFLFL